MPPWVRVVLPLAVLLCAVLATLSHAQGPLPDVPVVLGCRRDVRLFRSLSIGAVDYCRTHLRYVPGALDCYQLSDDVCSVWLPATGELVDLHQPRSRLAFPCPDGPEPPVCRRLDLQ